VESLGFGVAPDDTRLNNGLPDVEHTLNWVHICEITALSLFSAEKVSELNRFWREMAPVPGRMAGSLRFALTSALATLLLLILQVPAGFIAPALFMLFLVSHETPFRCFQDLLTLLSAGAMGTTAVLLLVVATGDHPVARVVGLAIFTFLAAFFFRTSVMPAFPMGFGCMTYMVISLWEYRIRAERILHLSLWPMASWRPLPAPRSSWSTCSIAAIPWLHCGGR
jgi:hypothetical protein